MTNNFTGLNQLYDYPQPKSVPTGRVVKPAYRCTVCANKIPMALYKGQDGRCNDCNEARNHSIEVGFMGRSSDAPITIRKEAGAQLGRLAGVEATRCEDCRAIKRFCKCDAEVKYQFARKEWRVR